MSKKKKQTNIKKNTPKKVVKPTKKKAPAASVKKSKTTIKKATTKIAKKLPAKKSPLKKPAPKAATKKVKAVKKKEVKQKPIKTTKIAKTSSKKTLKTSSPKQPKKAAKSTNLAKKILAKSTEKKPEVKIETAKKQSEISKNNKKSETKPKILFKVGDFAIYPSHGIGKIVDIEKITIHNQDFSCYLMYFEREKLTIKIPVNSAEKIGLRHLVSKAQMEEVFVTLRSGIKKLKGMWSRRAQEYETKINSGDIMLLAEVLRDLTRDIEDGDRSYSERIIYETAVIRLASEYSAIYGISFEEAKDKIILTAKDKVNSEGKIIQRDDFDDIDNLKDSDRDDEDEDEDEEGDDEDDEEGDDDDDDYFDDDDDDDAPKKRKRK